MEKNKYIQEQPWRTYGSTNPIKCYKAIVIKLNGDRPGVNKQTKNENLVYDKYTLSKKKGNAIYTLVQIMQWC